MTSPLRVADAGLPREGGADRAVVDVAVGTSFSQPMRIFAPPPAS